MAFIAIAGFISIAAHAATPDIEQIDDATRRLVEQLVLDRAAAIAAVKRQADDRRAALLVQLTSADRKIREALRSIGKAQEEITRLQGDLRAVTAERQELARQFASEDPTFSADLAEFRKQVTGLALSPDPRRRTALERYAEGDRSRSLDELISIQRAESDAVAAGWRQIGALASDMLDRGELKLAQVASIYERSQRLGPSNQWGWVMLARLYRQMGRHEDERYAADQARKYARNAREESSGFAEMGDVALRKGEIQDAAAAYARSVEILREINAQEPRDAIVQMNLAIGLRRLGVAEMSLHNLESARRSLNDSIQFLERLVAVNPGKDVVERHYISGISALAGLLNMMGDSQGSRSYHEKAVQSSRRLLNQFPGSTMYKFGLASSLYALGTLDAALHNVPAAEAALNEALVITRDVRDAGGIDWIAAQSQESGILMRLGDLAGIQQNNGRQMTFYEEGLWGARQVLAKDPDNPDRQRDTATILERMGINAALSRDTHSARAYFKEALQLFQRLATRTPANPDDLRELERTQELLANLSNIENYHP